MQRVKPPVIGKEALARIVIANDELGWRHRPPVRVPRIILTVSVFAFFLCATARAQFDGVEARVSSVKGTPLLSGGGVSPHISVRGDVLIPGQDIDTRSGGQITIELSDGSMVIVLPGSLIRLSDFHSATSVRELFEVLVGRVRVKINHYGSRPNPYRINSPTASIAVRGTEFSVVVDTTGTTQVSVSDGVVEVFSFTDPNRTVLVRPGQSIIIRPEEEIRFLIQEWEAAGNFGRTEDPEGSTGRNADSDVDKANVDSPRNSAGIYNQTIDKLLAARQNPLLTRFSAFPDSFLDSLENPAYTTEFQKAEGRLYLLPVFKRVQAPNSKDAQLVPPAPSHFDYGLSPQGFFFTPLPDKRTAVGVGVTALKSGAQSLRVHENARLTGAFFSPGTRGTRATSASTHLSILSGTLALSHAFGSKEQTSFGVGVDYSRSSGSIRNLITESATTGLSTNENVVSATSFSEIRFKLGLTHNFSSQSKLGLYYNSGRLQARLQDDIHLLNGVAQSPDSSNTVGQFSEAGIRFRSVLTSRLFYGLGVSAFTTNSNRQLRLCTGSDSQAQVHSAGGIATLGLGYALRPRILLTLDLSGGLSSVSFTRKENVTQNILEVRHTAAPFASSHEGVQADVWRHLFVDASVLTMWHRNTTNLILYPDRFGRIVTGGGIFAPNGTTVNRNFSYYSEYGAGWRFNENLLAEYVYSTTYGLTPPTHLIFLEYTFGYREK